MLKNDPAHDNQSLTNVALPSHQARAIEIAGAISMRLYALDLARHMAIAPDDKRYVVATFDDTRLDRGYVTAVYPQQNGYLTLIRLILSEFTSATPDEAIKRHVSLVQAIQQGRLKEFSKKV